MTNSAIRIPPILKQELEKQDDWLIERGARHFHIRIAGCLVGVLPFKSGDADRRAAKNIISQVRRFRKGPVLI